MVERDSLCIYIEQFTGCILTSRSPPCRRACPPCSSMSWPRVSCTASSRGSPRARSSRTAASQTYNPENQHQYSVLSAKWLAKASAINNWLFSALNSYTFWISFLLSPRHNILQILCDPFTIISHLVCLNCLAWPRPKTLTPTYTHALPTTIKH